MCLIAWNWQPDSSTPLILLSNRDEFYARPTQPLHWWDEGDSALLAGRDLQAGGTWLGMNRKGHLAALTNFRSTAPVRSISPSRGELVARFLEGNLSARDYLETICLQSHRYNPFNLLVFDGQELLGLESRRARVLTMRPGLGAVSNADFHTPWPKLVRLQQGLNEHLLAKKTGSDQVVALLHNTTLAKDEDLPRTGIPLTLERALSAAFIATPDYGTRACSVIHIHRDSFEFVEQSFGFGGLLNEKKFSFAVC